MSIYPIHTRETAPEGSRAMIDAVSKKYGFLPNLIGGLAEAPATAEGYVALGGIFEKANLTQTEKQVVLLTVSRLNECHYCVAAHTTISQMSKVDAGVIAALRNGTAIDDPKLEALRAFTEKAVEQRGWLEQADVDALIAAGYTRATALEVILGIAYKTISNYANHLVDTPVDDAFAPNAWSKAS